MKIELQSVLVSNCDCICYCRLYSSVYFMQNVQLVSITQLMTQLASSVLTILREIRLLLLSVSVLMATLGITETCLLSKEHNHSSLRLMSRQALDAHVSLECLPNIFTIIMRSLFSHKMSVTLQ